jgi:hypothetical protein
MLALHRVNSSTLLFLSLVLTHRSLRLHTRHRSSNPLVLTLAPRYRVPDKLEVLLDVVI